ncbi:MAG: TIR domain-containing protein [Pseudomarimonas sp.]
MQIEKTKSGGLTERFVSDGGRRLRVSALLTQKAVGGSLSLAEALADMVEIRAVSSGQTLIEQGGDDNDVFFILAGSFQVVVNTDKVVGVRSVGDHVGEMVAVEPSLRRSASVIALEHSVVARLGEAQLADVGLQFPNIYLYLAKELARRLNNRNAFVSSHRDRIRVFIISSTEALEVAQEVKAAFEHQREVFVEIWTEGVFKIANYTLDDLTSKVDESDFAIAIAHGDDVTTSREATWPAPRDNVIFELGLFMGRLGRTRAILMEPRDEKVKLPSDLTGITTVIYRAPREGETWAAALGTACLRLRKHILELGPNN